MERIRCVKQLMKNMNLFSVIEKKLTSRKKYPKYLRKQGVQIGENCEIYKSASFGSEPYLIEIGNHVRINSGVQLITHDGGIWVLRDPLSGYGEKFRNADCFGKIIIEDNVHIGTRAIIMPGVHIGKNSIVGCGAIVTHDIPQNSVVVGVPARVIESIDEYAEKMDKKYVITKNLSFQEKKEFLKEKYFV